MSATDLLHCSTTEQAALVRSGALSSVELCDFYLERIARLDGIVHAYSDFRPDLVRREARERERHFPARDLPPFWGVPVAVKDMNLAAGYFTKMGSRCFEDLFLVVDDPTVARLRRAGFVILGKTAVPELSSVPFCESLIMPPTRNPWDLGVTTGGSSGGAAAAIAAGLTPIAQGADGGGSIRIPSSICGLYGIKPSRGRVPNLYGFDDREVLYGDGPMGRSVEDVAALLDVMAGLTEGAPHWAPPPPDRYVTLARRDPPPLRIALATRSPLADTDPEVDRAVRRAAELLEERGHHVVEHAWPALDETDFLVLWKHTISFVHPPRPELLEPINDYLLVEGRKLAPDSVVHARSRMLAEIARLEPLADIWLTPTVPEAPNPIGSWAGLTWRQILDEARRVACFTAGFNVSGHPAASVPMGLSSRGHPIGVQVAGPQFREDLVLQVSRQILESLPPSSCIAPAFSS